MAELKTKPNAASVAAFLDGIKDQERQRDCRALVKLMARVTGAKPRMWGKSVVGFGSYHYKYASGREGDWFLTGFSPRKQDLTVYVMSGIAGAAPLLKKLGRHKTGVSCLYLKGLDGVDTSALAKLVERSVATLRERS